MRKNRVVEQNRCYHIASRLAHRAFFLDNEEKDRAVALMRRVEAGVKASMSYCINRTVSISSDPFDPCDVRDSDRCVEYWQYSGKRKWNVMFMDYKVFFDEHGRVVGKKSSIDCD